MPVTYTVTSLFPIHRQGETSQKACIFSNTAARNSDPAAPLFGHIWSFTKRTNFINFPLKEFLNALYSILSYEIYGYDF
jgi:hypothetical protein